MTMHGWEEHGLGQDSTPRFRMVLLRSFDKAMKRQIAQAVAIEMAKPDKLLNSKSEWGFPKIPRLRVEFGDTLVGDKTTRQAPTTPTNLNPRGSKRRVPPTRDHAPPTNRSKRAKTSAPDPDPTPIVTKKVKTVSFANKVTSIHEYDYRCGGACSFRTHMKGLLWAHVAQHVWQGIETDQDLLIVDTLDPPHPGVSTVPSTTTTTTTPPTPSTTTRTAKSTTTTTTTTTTTPATPPSKRKRLAKDQAKIKLAKLVPLAPGSDSAGNPDRTQGGPPPRGRGRPRTRPPESPRSQLTLAPGCRADPVGVLTTPTIPPAPPDLKRVLDPRGGPVVGGTQASEPPGPGPRARNSTTLRAKTRGTGDKEREGKLGGKGQ